MFVHWIADFVFQSRKWAIKKHESDKYLLLHGMVYSLIWVIPITFMYFYEMSYTILNSIELAILFSIITFMFHIQIDYCTSRIVALKFKNQDSLKSFPNFSAFTIIGLDQFLHYIQLILTYELIKIL